MPYWRLFYHITWGTKHRLPLVDPTWEENLHAYLWGKSVALECVPHAINGMSDHIHVVVSIPPKLAVATIIGKLKGSSSHHINHAILREKGFTWQAEYCVVTFSERHLSDVVAYVQNQKQHHSDSSLWENLEHIPSPGTPDGQPSG